MDRLEDFIKKNREAFDDANPPSFNWDDLKTPKKKETKFRSLKFLALAASLALLIGIFFSTMNSGKSVNIDQEMASELSELKVYYSSQVNNRFLELKKYNNDPDIEKDMKQMDTFLAELEAELEDVPASKREEVMEAMIQNYHTKLLMLERVLDQIKKTDKDNNDDTINI